MMDEAGGTKVFEGRIPEEAAQRHAGGLDGFYGEATGFGRDAYHSLVYRRSGSGSPSTGPTSSRPRSRRSTRCWRCCGTSRRCACRSRATPTRPATPHATSASPAHAHGASSQRSPLTAQGIDAARLEARGHGPSQPVADNDTDEGRAKNRRVELVRLD